MPLIILAGIPLPIFNRKKGYLPVVPGWQVSLIPSRDSKRADLRSCWKEVIAAADGSDYHGAHIFGFHDRESEHPVIQKKLHDRHRLIWMNRDSISNYGSDGFTKELESLIEFENIWRKDLMPQGVDAPHLLPESTFTPVNYGDIWLRVRLVTSSRDDVDRIVSRLGHFRLSHYRKGVWKDDNSLEFRVAADKHGLFDQHGHRKFSFTVPPGFHYDVTHEIPHRGFSVTDYTGANHWRSDRVNVDCHGSVRGGK